MWFTNVVWLKIVTKSGHNGVNINMFFWIIIVPERCNNMVSPPDPILQIKDENELK